MCDFSNATESGKNKKKNVTWGNFEKKLKNISFKLKHIEFHALQVSVHLRS